MRVLIVDDDIVTRQLIGAYCKQQKQTVLYAASGIEALEMLYKEAIDLVITDIRMPSLDGKKLLQEIKSFAPELPVLIMTAHSSIDEAVLLLKSGAEDYFAKPISPDVFKHRMDSVLNRLKMATELKKLKAASPLNSPIDSIVGSAPVMRVLLNRLPMMAQTDAAIMIYGESGTGKELVARAIHQLSKRNTKPFITVNCGALPDNLLESELFGYKKGAFTDAYQDTPGLVEAASGGTLFLDEIGEISSVVQVKLLRFLQSKEYKQLGSPRAQKANIRIICATNRNLKKMVDDKTFREDLFYRLNIVPITVPSLRERKTDIPVLANHFLNQFSDEYDKDINGFSSKVIQNLVYHNWPGNVRELENKIQQMVVLCEGNEIIHMDWATQIGFDELDTNYELENFKAEKKRVVDNFERHYIENMLEQTNGNLSEAAKRAGMDRKNFWQKARKHNLRSKATPVGI